MSARLSAARAICRTTERILVAGFGLATASPLQRGVCRIADGLPLAELWDDPHVRRALHTDEELTVGRPAEVSIVSGVRVAKSLIAGALAVGWSQRCDVSICGPGEVPRVSIISLTKDNAAVVFGHIYGRMMASDLLSELVVDVKEERMALEGGGFSLENTAKSVFVRHPTGIPIEIRVVAGARAGGSLVSRWSAGVIFDEYARMVGGGGEAVINYTDSRTAVLERLLPGAQIVNITSPWGPEGPCYDDINTHWGKPTRDKVVLRAPAYEMAPVLWPTERIERAKARAEREPAYAIVYRTDVEAGFLAPEENLFGDLELKRVTRESPIELPAMGDHEYVAGMDPATRRNAWTLVVMTREGRKKRVVLARQWLGALEPLSPRQVISEIAVICREYGIKTLETDQYHADSLREFASDEGLFLNATTYTETEHAKHALKVQARVLEGEVELPPVEQFRADMTNVKRRTTNTGLSIVLARTRDGRHADYWPAFMRAMARYLEDVAAPPVEDGTTEAMKREEARMLADAAKRFTGRKRR